MSKRNIKGWKSRPKDYELTSGACVTIKRVSLSAMMAHGEVPQVFFSALVQDGPGDGGVAQPPAPNLVRKPGTVGYRPATASAARGATVDPSSKLAVEELKELTAFARAVARDALVWPKVVDKPSESEDEVTLDEIPVEDLFEIMAHAINNAPVATTEGEVSAEALHKTSEVGQLQGGGGGGADVPPASG